MRTSTRTLVLVLATFTLPFVGLVGPGCSSGGGTPATDGGAGKGSAGKGAAGTGAAGTGSAGTGAAGTGAAGTGAAGTGAAGTGAAGTGAAGTGAAGTGAAGTGAAGTGAAGTGAAGTGTDAGAGADGGATDGPKDASEAGADTGATDTAADLPQAETSASETGAETSVNACTNIELPTAIFASYVTAALPAPAGGDIAEGTYKLTSLVHYASATASTGNDPIRSAIKFAGNTIEWANQAKTDPATRASYTYTKGTTTLSLTNVCPTAGPGGSPGYTATATTFKLYLDAEYVYTKL
jgi:hypothetical protein